MRILQISDLHYRPNIREKLDISIMKPMIESLRRHAGTIDYVIFCGDLVWSGKEYNHFIEARKMMIDKVMHALNLTYGRIIISPGNHDMDRSKELPMLAEHFEAKIQSNKCLNKFVDGNDQQYLLSTQGFDNYTKFIRTISEEVVAEDRDIIHPLYSIHTRKHNKESIGFVSLNSAWRAVMDKPKGKLVIPTSILESATYAITDCDIKIAILHHDTGYLAEYNQHTIEDKLYHNYDIILNGHIHKPRHAVYASQGLGALCCACSATLSFEHESVNSGYALIDIDMNSNTADISEYKLHSIKSKYTLINNVHLDIPVGEAKRKQNKLRRRIRERYEEECDRANELFVSTKQDEIGIKFMDMFTDPILRTKRRSELENEENSETIYEFTKILEDNTNYLILGKSKTGKTVILKRIQLQKLNEYHQAKALPIYIDVKRIKSERTAPDISRIFARYYGVSKADGLQIRKNHSIVLLVDNYDPYANEINEEIFLFLRSSNETRIIAASEDTLSKANDTKLMDGIEYKKLHIDQITRKQIRKLTSNWPGMSEKKKEKAIEKIVSVFQQMHIPFSYWTVSLFLWVFERDSNVQLENNTELIGLYVDELLDRSSVLSARGTNPAYSALKKFLAALAGHMVTMHRESTYAMNLDEIHKFIGEYRSNNLRFTASATEVMRVLVGRGVLRQRYDEKYCFRLKGIFEYFIALNMVGNTRFRESILDNDHVILSFGNEIELYAGIVKNDQQNLRKIGDKVEKLFNPIMERYKNIGTIDDNLVMRYNTLLLSPSLQESIKPLESEKRDELLETVAPIAVFDSDVEKKEYISALDERTDHLEKMITILSRVYRNSEEINNDDLLMKVFDLIIECHCIFGLWLIDEIEIQERNVEREEDEESEMLILRHLTNFLPLMIQILLNDGIGHISMMRVIERKIDELEGESEGNEFKLMLLYLLKIDIQPIIDVKILKRAIKRIRRIKALKNAIKYKMYYYIMFKCEGKTDLENEIKALIRELTEDLNSEIDKGSIEKGFAQISKQRLLRE